MSTDKTGRTIQSQKEKREKTFHNSWLWPEPILTLHKRRAFLFVWVFFFGGGAAGGDVENQLKKFWQPMKYHKRSINGVNWELLARKGGQISGKSSKAWDCSTTPSTSSPSTLSFFGLYHFLSLSSFSVSLTVFILGLTGPMAMFGQCSKSQGLWWGGQATQPLH